jgi:Leucine-rich repeat (LRR) protein
VFKFWLATRNNEVSMKYSPLSLMGLQLSKLPFLARFISFGTIDLTDNRFSTLPKWLANKQISTIDLRYNCLKKIPSIIYQLHQLENLSIGANDIQTIPKEIGRLTNLKHLSVPDCNIEVVPNHLCDFKNLEYLNISNNQKINHLPENIGKLTNLSGIDFSKTGIKSLPKSMFKIALIQKSYSLERPFYDSIILSEKRSFSFKRIFPFHLIIARFRDKRNKKLSYLGGEAFRMTSSLRKKVGKYNHWADCFQLLFAIAPSGEEGNYLAEFWNKRIKCRITEQRPSIYFRGPNLDNVPIDWSLLKDTSINSIHFEDCCTILPDAIGHLTHLKGLHIEGDCIDSLPSSLRKLDLESFHFSSYKGALSRISMNTQLSPKENIDSILAFIDNLTTIQSDSNIQNYISQIERELHSDKKNVNTTFHITQTFEAAIHNRLIIVGYKKENDYYNQYILALVNTQTDSLISILSDSGLQQRDLLLTQNYFLANIVDICVWDLKTGKLVEEHNGTSIIEIKGDSNSDIIFLKNSYSPEELIEIHIGSKE